MSTFRGIDIWQLARIYRNPMGPAAALGPGGEIPNVHVSDVVARRDAVREELVRRGFDGDEIEVIGRSEAEGNEVIRGYLARGGSRHGAEEE